MVLKIISLICTVLCFLTLVTFVFFVIFKLRKIESQTDSTLKHCCRMSIYMNNIHQMEQNTKTSSSEYRMDKSIEKRAKLYLEYEQDFLGRNLSENMVCRAYLAGAREQKAIDDAELNKLMFLLKKEAQK